MIPWLLALIPCLAQAAGSVEVKDAWVRATLPGQAVAGAYFEIASPEPARLTGAATPLARAAEIHSMKVEGGVMRMSALPALELPPGKTVKLTPGGYHVMLLGISRQLKPGDKVPLSLTVETAKGPRTLTVEAMVREADR